MPQRLTGRELLTLIGQLRGLEPDVGAQRGQDLLEVMGPTGAKQTLSVDYSTGMPEKFGPATALLHARPLLVLDEPFEAVDPVRRLPSGRFLSGSSPTADPWCCPATCWPWLSSQPCRNSS